MSSSTLRQKCVPLSPGATQIVSFYDNGANMQTWNDIAIAPGNTPIYLLQARANIVQPTAAIAVNMSTIIGVLSADHTQIRMILAVYSLFQNTANGQNLALSAEWDAPAGYALQVNPGDVVAVQFLLGTTPNIIWGEAIYS